MALSKERKEQLAEHLRGTSVAKENITRSTERIWN